MLKRLLTSAALAAALFGAGTALAAPPKIAAKVVTVKGVVMELMDGTVTLQLSLTPEQKKAARAQPHVTQGMPVGPNRMSADKGEIYGRWHVDGRNPELSRALAKLRGGEVVIEFDAARNVTKVERVSTKP